MSTDYYAVLGILPNATNAEIRKAYRKKSFETHPDCRPGLKPDTDAWKEANARMRLVVEAWEILGDPERKAHYDRSRANPADAHIQEVVRQETRQAEKHSAEYPKEWDQFQEWQKDVWEELGQTKKFTPRFAFIVGGGLVCAFLAYQIVSPTLAQTSLGGYRDQYPNLWFWVIFWCCLSLAMTLLANAANSLASLFPFLARLQPVSAGIREAKPKNVRQVTCSGCGVTLRFPEGGKMRLTCPKCGSKQHVS
jgi:curved DNA-binding protein CbpA